MPNFDPNLMKDAAKARFASEQLPPGTDRNRFNGYLDQISAAVARAMDQWKAGVTLNDVMIQGPIATGGKLTGLPLEPLIIAQAPGDWMPYNKAIAAGIHNQMFQLAQSVTVPGLPWYPPLAAFPGPVAPPTPNIPSPFMAICAAGIAHVGPDPIKNAIIVKFMPPKPACADNVAVAVAVGFNKVLIPFLSSCLIQRVMGSGPVPGFAPPVRPMGPVVGGRGSMAPGGLT